MPVQMQHNAALLDLALRQIYVRLFSGDFYLRPIPCNCRHLFEFRFCKEQNQDQYHREFISTIWSRRCKAATSDRGLTKSGESVYGESSFAYDIRNVSNHALMILPGENSLKRLIEESEIREKVSALGEQIAHDYRDHPLTVLGVLTGSIVLLSDLIRKINLPLRVGLIQASSYRGAAVTAGDLTINSE